MHRSSAAGFGEVGKGVATRLKIGSNLVRTGARLRLATLSPMRQPPWTAPRKYARYFGLMDKISLLAGSSVKLIA